MSHLVETWQVHVGGKRADHGTGRQKPGEQMCVDFVGIVDRLEGDAHFLFVLQWVAPHCIAVHCEEVRKTNEGNFHAAKL